MEEALQHNETLDILKDDFLLAQESLRSLEHPTTEEGLKEVVTFSDFLHTKNKLISSVQWVPEYAFRIQVSGDQVYHMGCSHAEQTAFIMSPTTLTMTLTQFMRSRGLFCNGWEHI